MGWSFSTGSWTLMNLSCGKRNGVVICPSTWHVPNLFSAPKCCQAEGSKEDFLKDFFKTFKATKCVKPRNSICFKGLKVWTNCQHRIRSTARQECFGLLGMKTWSPSLHCEFVSKMQAEEQNIRDALASVNGEARPAFCITLQQIEMIKKDMKWQGWYELNRIDMNTM